MQTSFSLVVFYHILLNYESKHNCLNKKLKLFLWSDKVCTRDNRSPNVFLIIWRTAASRAMFSSFVIHFVDRWLSAARSFEVNSSWAIWHHAVDQPVSLYRFTIRNTFVRATPNNFLMSFTFLRSNEDRLQRLKVDFSPYFLMILSVVFRKSRHGSMMKTNPLQSRELKQLMLYQIPLDCDNIQGNPL